MITLSKDSEFNSKLNELVELSDDSNLAIALAEAYNPRKLSFLGPHNEMRNALFHVMEMIKAKDNEGEKCDSEFKAAKSHFRRAGCDAYELLSLSCIKYIGDLLSEFDSDDINICFPDYYNIRQTANEISEKVAKIKLDKDLKKRKSEELFEYFFDQASILVDCVKKINEHIPAIIVIQKQKKKKKLKEQFFQVGIAIAIAVLFFVLGLYIKV